MLRKLMFSIILLILIVSFSGASAERDIGKLLCIALPEGLEVVSQSDIGLTFQWEQSTWRTMRFAHDEEKPLEARIDEAYAEHGELIACKAVLLDGGEAACYRFDNIFEGDEYPVYCAWYCDETGDYLLLVDIGKQTPEEIEAQLDGLSLRTPEELVAAQ